MKYLPSGVQRPQQSPLGSPLKRGCAPTPSTDASHRLCTRRCSSYTVKRTRLPSGDHAGAVLVPATVATIRAAPPSLWATNRSPFLVYAIRPPSCDHAAEDAVRPPMRCADPPGMGTLQSG